MKTKGTVVERGRRFTGWKKALVLITLCYLAIGIAVAKATDQGQIWVCPAPGTPHGTTVGNFQANEECRPTIASDQRVQRYVWAIIGWPILVFGAPQG